MSLPKDPRMQMINMMYLVLMALLAINVSAEILKGFRIVQVSLEKSNENADEKIVQLHSVFKTALNNDPQNEVIQEYAGRAEKVRIICDGLIGRVEQFKSDLEVLGTPDAEGGMVYVDNGSGIGELKNASDQDISAQYFLLNGLGDQFQEEINKTRASLFELVSPKEVERLQTSLSLEEAVDPPSVEGETRTWAEDYFDNMPLAAVVTLMEKFRSDIKSTHIEMLSSLMGGISQGNWNFDKMESNIVSTNRYLQQGQSFESQIFVSAYSSTLEPQVFIGKLPADLSPLENGKYETIVQKNNPLLEVYDTLSTKEGKGSFRAKSSLGNHAYEGVILMVNNGKHYWFPFKDDYEVVNTDATVSASAMNVIYAGLWNPFQISVPGYALRDVDLIVPEGVTKRKLSHGKYEVKTNKGSGKLKFKIRTRESDGSFTTKDGGEFRLFGVPAPQVSLKLDQYTSISSGDRVPVGKAGKVARSSIDALLRGFVLNGVKFKIKKWKGIYTKKRGGVQTPFESSNPSLASVPSLKSYLSKCQRGDQLNLFDIKVQDPAGKTLPMAYNVIIDFK